jgi:hypothetical protein
VDVPILPRRVEELDFIIAYDIEYRMDRGAGKMSNEAAGKSGVRS